VLVLFVLQLVFLDFPPKSDDLPFIVLHVVVEQFNLQLFLVIEERVCFFLLGLELLLELVVLYLEL
jgi:hypothetical protein